MLIFFVLMMLCMSEQSYITSSIIMYIYGCFDITAEGFGFHTYVRNVLLNPGPPRLDPIPNNLVVKMSTVSHRLNAEMAELLS